MTKLMCRWLITHVPGVTAGFELDCPSAILLSALSSRGPELRGGSGY